MNTPDPRWDAFAAREPYFAILNAEKYRRAHLTPEALAEFFDGGATLAKWILNTIELRITPGFAPVSILEYGCGVGRLAIPLARRGGRVTAVDRSPAMLAVAREEASRRDAAHVEFLPPHDLAADRKFDLVVSYLVFQRLPPREGLELLDMLLSRLGSGGVGVFHFPGDRRGGPLVDLSRLVRQHVPGANAVANLALGKPEGEPFVPTYSYKLNDVLRVLGAHRIDPTFVSQGDNDQLVLFAQAPVAAKLSAADSRSDAAVAAPPPISAEQVVRASNIDELNQRAEEYFSTLKDWDHHLAKPFADLAEAPDLLTDIAVLLRGLRLYHGARVADFGSGPGWLSRFLTQLGCETVLIDVSPTALAMARQLYERLPVFGDRPAPGFCVFDGHRIELPDASIDRIVSFHAFHHVPNPDAVIAEFARVLKPGGIAGFVEPGPRHSETGESQFEMRTYGVVERDVDIHAIWRSAASVGFGSIELAVWHAPKFHLSLDKYEDFLAGGATKEQWVNATREFARHVRTFFLTRAGKTRLDSRSVTGLSCTIRVEQSAVRVSTQSPIVIAATVTNTGEAAWLSSSSGRGGVSLGGHLHTAGGGLIAFDAIRAPLTEPPRDINPGESVMVPIALPPQAAGRYRLELDCVAEGVTWFSQLGSNPAAIDLEVIV